MTQPNTVTRDVAQRTIDTKTKPLGALGIMEDIAVRLAVLQRTLLPSIDRTRVCVFAGDHGVTDEGVSAYPRSVTAEMMKNFDRGGAAINVIARANTVDVEVIDVGVDADLDSLSYVHKAKVRRGTRNFVVEPAMASEELDDAMEVGASAVLRAAESGVSAIGLGEMGIGNTTSASALLSVLTGQSSSATVGRGTGVTDAGLSVKRSVVDRAIDKYSKDSTGVDAREFLRCVGGLELAAMVGAALEASRRRMAIVADGFISTVSVLCAARIARAEGTESTLAFQDAIFFGHRSTEIGHGIALDACAATLGQSARPLLDLEMRLGEGSGAALAMPLLRAAAAIMREMATFASAGVSAGEHAAEHGSQEDAR